MTMRVRRAVFGVAALLALALPKCGSSVEADDDAEDGPVKKTGGRGGATAQGGSTPGGSTGEGGADDTGGSGAAGAGDEGGMDARGGQSGAGGTSGSDAGGSDATGGSAGSGGSTTSGGSGGNTAGAGGAGGRGAGGTPGGAGFGGSATNGGSGGNTAGRAGAGGSGGGVLVQELVDGGYVGIRQDLGVEDSWSWWYHDGTFVPFNPALGTLESITVEGTIDIDFEIPPGMLGNSFRYVARLFKDNGARNLLYHETTFPISTASMTDTYSWTEAASSTWSEPDWRYYFEVRGQRTPITFRHVLRITYNYAPAD
jgi:hypothetical protein